MWVLVSSIGNSLSYGCVHGFYPPCNLTESTTKGEVKIRLQVAQHTKLGLSLHPDSLSDPGVLSNLGGCFRRSPVDRGLVLERLNQTVHFRHLLLHMFHLKENLHDVERMAHHRQTFRTSGPPKQTKPVQNSLFRRWPKSCCNNHSRLYSDQHQRSTDHFVDSAHNKVRHTGYVCAAGNRRYTIRYTTWYKAFQVCVCTIVKWGGNGMA